MFKISLIKVSTSLTNSKQKQGKILTIRRFFYQVGHGQIKKVVLRGNLFYLYSTGENYVKFQY